MTNWQQVKLGDICEITSSKRIFMADYVDSGIPFYRSKEIIEKQRGNNISTELFITEEKYEEIKQKFSVPQGGDILLTSVGTLGIPYIVRENEKFYFKDGNLTWIKKSKNFLPEYLYYYLISDEGKFKLENISIGTTQKAITIVGLKSLEISLPPLDIQKKIAGVLGALDDKIELNNKINNNLEQQAQALFKSWFVDFEPFGGKMPDDWKIGKLEDVVDVIMGQSPSGNSYNEKGRGCIFFQGRAEFGFRFPTIKLFTTEPRRMARQNDILMSVRAPVGDVNVAHEDCCIGRGLCAIRSKDNFQSFIFYTLWSVQNKLNIFNGEGTVFGSINKDSLNNLEIIVPNSNTIQKFENLCSPMDNLIRKNYEENTRLSALRDTLLPKLMSGEIDVSNVDISALTSTDKLSFNKD